MLDQPNVPIQPAAGQEFAPSWGQLFRIWWAFFWRGLLLAIPAGAGGGLIGFAVGSFGARAHLPVPLILGVTWLIVLPPAIFVGMLVVKLVLGRRLGQFRVVTVWA